MPRILQSSERIDDQEQRDVHLRLGLLGGANMRRPETILSSLSTSPLFPALTCFQQPGRESKSVVGTFQCAGSDQ